MIGVLYVFHGSQKNEKNQAAAAFIQQLQQRLDPTWIQATAFLENHPDTIVNMSRKMIDQGVTQLVVVPVLLFAAKHALVDIPAEVELVKVEHPQIKISQTETFGSKVGSRTVLLERFQEIAEENPDEQLIGFLVAHGTKKTDEPQQVLVDIASEIQEQVHFPIFATSLKGNENYLETINQQLQKDQTAVIVPFFLFDGHLITIMKDTLKERFPTQNFIMTRTLEFDPRILADLEKIVIEGVQCIQ